MPKNKGCHTCRYHSKDERRKALAVGDGELELVEFDDDLQIVFLCRHPSLDGRAREIGAMPDDPDEQPPGATCALWEPGRKQKLDPALARKVDKALSDG